MSATHHSNKAHSTECPKIKLITPDSQRYLGAEILFQLVVFIQECKGLMPDGSGLNISGSNFKIFLLLILFWGAEIGIL